MQGVLAFVIIVMAAVALSVAFLSNTINLNVQQLGVGEQDLVSPINNATVGLNLGATILNEEIANFVDSCLFHSPENIAINSTIICKVTDINGSAIAEGNLFLIGAGYNASETAQIFISTFFEVNGFADDPANVHDIKIVVQGPRPAEIGPATCSNPVSDRCIDVDGTLTTTDGIGTGQNQVTQGAVLFTFPPFVFNNSGLGMFDNDGDGQWTFDTDGAGPLGDDLHIEGPAFCALAIADGVHSLGQDCIVLDPDGSLFNGQAVDCDLETLAISTSCPPLAGVGAVRYHDANFNNAWDDGEDIILDRNGNGIFD